MRSDAPSDASGSDVGSATASDSHEGRLAKRAKTSDAVEPWSEAAGSLVHGALQSMEQRYLFLLRTSTPGKVIEDMQKEFDGKGDDLGGFFVWKCKMIVSTLLRAHTSEAARASKCNEAVALAQGTVALRPMDNEATYHAAYALKLAGHSEPALELLDKATRTDHWSSALGQLESRCKLQSVIEMLPEHLFVDILALLQTHELAPASAVCRRWNSVVNTPYLWRSLSFIPRHLQHDSGLSYEPSEVQPKFFGKVQVPWDNILARAQGSLVGVDLAYIPPQQLPQLIQALGKASTNLRHITWSIEPDGKHSEDTDPGLAVARQAFELAQDCPRLTSLEVMTTRRMYVEQLPPELASGLLQICNLRHFSSNAIWARGAFPHLFRLLLRAKSVTLHGRPQRVPILEYWLLDLLRNNDVIEQLSIRAFQDTARDAGHLSQVIGRPITEHEAAAPGITTALSLKILDLRNAGTIRGSEVRLHAPKLRELAIDARLLCKLSEESTLNLHKLTLQIQSAGSSIGVSQERGPGPMEGIQRFTNYAGDLTLSVRSSFVEPVLELLASEMLWPGLRSVTVTPGIQLSLIHYSQPGPGLLAHGTLGHVGFAALLMRVIAAREAGARGASREQYIGIANGTISACAQMAFSAPPLCAEVQWRINNYRRYPEDAIAWLRTRGNVRLCKTSDEIMM